jgi:MoaA/NifB/PqqE/SkfB family radical SAM enzyme
MPKRDGRHDGHQQAGYHMTGGEPLLRSDIFDLAQYGTDKGFRMVMATNGTLVTEESFEDEGERHPAGSASA